MNNNNNNLNKRMHKGGKINALISVKPAGGRGRGKGMGWGFDCLCRPWGGAFD